MLDVIFCQINTTIDYPLDSDSLTIQFDEILFTPSSTTYSEAFGKFYSTLDKKDTVLKVRLNSLISDPSTIICRYSKFSFVRIILSSLIKIAFTIFYAANGLAFFDALRQKDHGRVRMYRTLNYGTISAIFVIFSFI